MPNANLKIALNNAAFTPMIGPELADALRTLADEIEGVEEFEIGYEYTVRDTNGNTVGRFEVRP